MTMPGEGQETGAAAPPQSVAVRERLRAAILTGELPAGDFLSEGRLAARHGVSRTPVREAIRDLAAEGLVTLRPRQRAVVRGMSVRDILDRFEAMAEMEASCARLAARRRSTSELAAMTAQLAACRAPAEASDLRRYYPANERFHEMIYAAAGNAYLERETVRLRDRMRVLRMTPGTIPGRLLRSLGEHEDILDRIAAQNEESASTLMRRHLMIQEESLRTLVLQSDGSEVVHLPKISGEDDE